VVDLTTFPAPSGIADLRPRTSAAALGVANPCGGGPVNIEGTVLDDPPSQPNGGGFNSSMSVSSVDMAATGPGGSAEPRAGSKGRRGSIIVLVPRTGEGVVQLDAPLTNGSSINVQFLLGIQQTGIFKFFINVEALP
jgi:hypothetical protein